MIRPTTRPRPCLLFGSPESRPVQPESRRQAYPSASAPSFPHNPAAVRHLPAKSIYGVAAGKDRKRNAIPKHSDPMRFDFTVYCLRSDFKLRTCHEYALLCSLHARISAIFYSLFRILQNNARHIFFFPNEKKKENPERILLHLTFNRRYNTAHAHPA